mmetsp:Transcript_11894/g.28158  ORF Transcript_11894/g.28158 Transcript_11894/m.28158 type:complete len:369 (+) Transcript_11894:678-1784(+)
MADTHVFERRKGVAQSSPALGTEGVPEDGVEEVAVAAVVGAAKQRRPEARHRKGEGQGEVVHGRHLRQSSHAASHATEWQGEREPAAWLFDVDIVRLDCQHAGMALPVDGGDPGEHLRYRQLEGPIAQKDLQGRQVFGLLHHAAVAEDHPTRRLIHATELVELVVRQHRAHDAHVEVPRRQQDLVGTCVHQESGFMRGLLVDRNAAPRDPERFLAVKVLGGSPHKAARLDGVAGNLAQGHVRRGGAFRYEGEDRLAAHLLQALVQRVAQLRDGGPSQAANAVPVPVPWELGVLHDDERLVLDLSSAEGHGILHLVPDNLPGAVAHPHRDGAFALGRVHQRWAEARGPVRVEHVRVLAACAALGGQPQV